MILRGMQQPHLMPLSGLRPTSTTFPFLRASSCRQVQNQSDSVHTSLLLGCWAGLYLPELPESQCQTWLQSQQKFSLSGLACCLQSNGPLQSSVAGRGGG